MTFEEIGKLVRAKEAERRAKLTPEERAEEDRRQEERRRRDEDEYLAKKDATVPLLEYERDIRDLEALLDLVQGEADERLGNLANMALEKLQAQQAKLEAARARIDALLDANLKAQDMKRQLDRIEAQTAPSLTRAQIRDISNHFNTVGSSGTRGYVLDFTDRTFDTFATDVVGHTIRRPGMSKWKSLDAYLMEEATPDEARRLLVALLDHEEATSGETDETRRIRDIIAASKAGKADAIEAHLDAKLDDIKGLVEASKAQGDRIEGKVGDIDGKVNETQNAANLALKADRAIASKLKTVGPCIASAVERGMEKTTRAVSGARVQLDHLKAAIEKKDDDLEGVRQLQRDTLAAVHELKDGKPAQDETAAPDPRAYKVTTTKLANMLTKLGAGRSVRQIQLWEKHLKTDGSEGTPPPDGYNLGTRLTIETATAWAQTFASHETCKLKTKIAFDDRFHQRPK